MSKPACDVCNQVKIACLEETISNVLYGCTTKVCKRFVRSHFPRGFVFVLRLNVPVNNFSVMSGRSHHFLGITRTLGE